MRFGYIVPLGFGLLLIYMAVFGLGGFGVSATFSLGTTSLPQREEFADLNGWALTPSPGYGSGIPIIQPVGADDHSVFLDASGTSLSQVSHGITSLVTAMQWTFSIYGKVTGMFQMQFWGTTFKVYVNVWQGGTVTSNTGSGLGFVDNAWHLLSMEVTVSGTDPYSNYQASAQFYVDGALRGSFSSSSLEVVNWSPAVVLAASSGGQATVDFIDLESGLLSATQLQALIPNASPTPSPGTATGSLIATCRVKGVNKAGATVKIAGITSSPTGSDGTVTIPNIPEGTYSATASVSGFLDVTIDNIVISSTAPTSKTFEFSGAGTTVAITTQVIGGHGTITPSGEITIGYASGGFTKDFTITADSGYCIASIVLHDPSTSTGDQQISFTPEASSKVWTCNTNNVQTSRWLQVTFMTSSSSTGSWTITTVKAGEGGSITGSPTQLMAGSATIPSGQAETITVNTNNPSFTITSVTVDGQAVTDLTSGATTYSHTFPATTTGPHSLGATIASSSGPSPTPSQSPGTSPSPSSSPQIPQINFNIDLNGIWKNLNAMVDANRQPLLAIGGLIALFSFVGLILPAKRFPFSF